MKEARLNLQKNDNRLKGNLQTMKESRLKMLTRVIKLVSPESLMEQKRKGREMGEAKKKKKRKW
ncbi:hypothetical protein Hanom_Chr12g01080201 [Helianthus anomalus]